MLHYKSDLTIQKALTGIKGAEKRTDTVYVGGPVDLSVVLALLRSKSTPEDGGRVTGNLYLMAGRPGLEAALTEGRPESDLRVFIGYSGWGPASWSARSGVPAGLSSITTTTRFSTPIPTLCGTA